MYFKFIIIAFVHLSYRCNVNGDAEYTYQANAVSEAAEQMTVYWNGDKLIGGQQFEVLVMPADVAPVTTSQQFIVIDKLDPSKSYEFTVFLIKSNMKTPIAYTRGQVLPKGSSPTCQDRCYGKYNYVLAGYTDEQGKVFLHLMNETNMFPETERFLLETTPPDVPKIITEKSIIVVDKLKPGTLYKFMVYLRDENGILQTPSADASIQTLPQDDNNPTDLITKVYNPNRIDLEWKAAPNADCEIITYTVRCTSHPGKHYTTEGTKYAILNLLPLTSYTFTVHSTKADGTFYPHAPKVGQITWSEYTYSPRDVTAEHLSPTSIRLRWTAAVESYQTPTLYKVLTNLDKKNAEELELRTIDIQNLSPSTEYIFTVHATLNGDYLLMPGAEVKTRTLDKAAK